MGTVGEKSDEEFSVIGDKGDIGFIDLDNCRSVCDYNPSAESQIVNISVPFPLVNGKPQSGFVGETKFDSITIKNITNESLDLWSVKIYDSKPENSFTLSIMKPPTADSDAEYIEDFMESFALEDRVLRTDQDLIIWLSCKPKEIGVHSAAVHFSVGDEKIERLVFVLAEDKISKSLSVGLKPYQRTTRKKPDAVKMPNEDAVYVVGQRTSKGSSNGLKPRLKEYRIPDDIRDMVSRKQIPSSINDGLTMRNYASFFKALLAMEEIKLEEDMQAYEMEGVTLSRKRNNFLSLEVPGLAEKRPSLVNGDYIFVRLVGEDGTTSVPYQGYIHRVEAEEIHLKFNPKFHSSHWDGNLYNVCFTYNRKVMQRMYQAVEAAESLDKNFLFPSVSSRMKMLKHGPFVPKSCTLNKEQKNCIKTILDCRGGCPYLIHGPPGTGKTTTLIEAILQIYTTKGNARILVCTPSNSAADHILERIIGQESVAIQQNQIFRLNAFSRPFEDVEPNLHKFCCFNEEGIFKCPSRGYLVRCRIIISTYTSAYHLNAEGIRKGHFSYIFLDEAGQASEPETMVPLSQFYKQNTVVVLAGDPKQLGPVVFSRDAERYGLGTSYLERLFGCELYRSGNEKPMIKLIRNYRTHEAILRLPSELFYDAELIPCKEDSTSGSSLPWEDLIPNKSFPSLFIGIQGCDEREGSNPSWFNRIEASKVVEIVRTLIENKMKDQDIGVITPYRQQVCKIRGALEGLDNMDGVKVGSVEQFQGQEREVIIISTVRSTVKHNEFDKLHYLGFLSNPRRFNVAITRARSLLIVIGNPHILCKDPNWSRLLWYCVDNDSYKGCFLPEREVSSFEGQAGTGENKWGAEGDKWQPDGTQWGQETQWGEDNWKPSQDNWGGNDSNWDPSGSGTQRGEDNWKPTEDDWGGDDSNWKPSETEDNWKTTVDNWAADASNWKPSDSPWD